MASRHATIEKWVWILIYGGLLTLVVGLAVRSRDGALAVSLVAVGGVLAAAGVVLIVVRSRMKDDARPHDPQNKPMKETQG